MKSMMMTVAAMALATPAFAQTVITTDDALTTEQAPAAGMGEASPLAADGTTAPIGTMDPVIEDDADGIVTTEPGMTTGTMADGMATGGTMTGGAMTDGTMTDGMMTDGMMTTPGNAGMDGTVVTAQPMATTGGMMQEPAAQLSIDNPGITASWLIDRAIYTTNQPSTTAWVEAEGEAVPGDWNEIANVSDLVMTMDGALVGYVADIGGFLGLGAHTVLLDRSMLHVSRFGDDIVLATNYTQEELEALPEYDPDSVMR